jgi:hypothetical protein
MFNELSLITHFVIQLALTSSGYLTDSSRKNGIKVKILNRNFEWIMIAFEFFFSYQQ